jgi:PTH1 family peptidyl-tRNA hydrolase
MDSKCRILVGLGNPGKEYELTRHNVGFLAIDAFVTEKKMTWKHEPMVHAMIAEGNIDGVKTVCVKPMTYMNASGDAVRCVMDRFHANASSLFIISDDIDLPLGTLRFRTEGSAGGHNGLQSIIRALGTSAFARLKIGVSAPPPNVPLEAYVLQRFCHEEEKILDRVIVRSVDILRQSACIETTWTV